MTFDCICSHRIGAHLNPDTGEFWSGSVRCVECEDEVMFGERMEPECQGYFQAQEAQKPARVFEVCDLCEEPILDGQEKLELYPNYRPGVWGHWNCAESAWMRQEKAKVR